MTALVLFLAIVTGLVWLAVLAAGAFLAFAAAHLIRVAGEEKARTKPIGDAA
jgi:hypothetical protein